MLRTLALMCRKKSAAERSRRKEVLDMKKSGYSLGSKIPNAMRREVYRRDGYMCALCGDPRKLEIHHYRHRSLGGVTHPMNLITLCPYCHAVIHHQTAPVADFMDAEELDQACAEYLGDYYAGQGMEWYVWDG